MPNKKNDITQKKNSGSTTGKERISWWRKKRIIISISIPLGSFIIIFFVLPKFDINIFEMIFNIDTVNISCSPNQKNSTESSVIVSSQISENPDNPSESECSKEETSPNHSSKPEDVSPTEEPHNIPSEPIYSQPFVEPSVFSDPIPQPSLEQPNVTPVYSVPEPSDSPITGTCGEGITYEFDTVNGKLTISGTGEISDSFEPFERKSDIKTVVIESGITSICDNAFYGCSNLETVEIPDDIVSVNSNVFVYCTALKTIDLSQNLQYLGDGAFSYCTSLEEITIPEKVTAIYNDTFKDCTKLKKVYLSQNVTEIDDTAFTGCDQALTIYAPKGSYAEIYANAHNDMITFYETESSSVT